VTRFDFTPTRLSGLTVVQRKAFEDDRGFLSRLYCTADFSQAGMEKAIAQINHSLTRTKGAVRGLHVQYPPHAEMKLVSCLSGVVYDVAVDLRRHSPTFLQWHSEILSASNRKSLLIPEGCAHGFQALTEYCELIYLHTAIYSPEAEGALNVADPTLGISWPLPIEDLSDRDRNHPFIGPEYPGIDL